MSMRYFIPVAVLFAVGILASTSYGEIDPDNIAGLWLFDEGEGDEARDSSGSGYHGILEDSPAWVDGRFGKALEFNGSEYVEIQDSALNFAFAGIEPFSITAWVKHQGGGYVVSKFNRMVIGAYTVSIGSGGTINFHREVDPWGLAGTKALPSGQFGHAAVTYDGAEMKIYVDAELDVAQDRGAQGNDTVTPVLIGARFRENDIDPEGLFRGVIDEVAIFNVALTEDQLAEVMRGLSLSKAVSASGKLASKWGDIKKQ
jgi:hypothetical protein